MNQRPIVVTHEGKFLVVNPVRDPIYSWKSIGVHPAYVLTDGETATPSEQIFVVYDREQERVLEIPGDGSLSDAQAMMDNVLKTLRRRISKGATFEEVIKEMYPREGKAF